MFASGEPRTNAAAIRGVMSLDEDEYPDGDFSTAIERGHTIVETRLGSKLVENTDEVRASLAWAETYAAAHYFYSDHAGVGLGITDPDYGGAIVEVAEELDVREEVNVDHLQDAEWLLGPNGIPSPYWGMACSMDPTPENYLAKKQHRDTILHTG